MALFKIKDIENFKLNKNLCLIDGICTENSIYFTTDTKIIVVYFQNKINYLTTDKEYSKITYDNNEKCFYATTLDDHSSIFKLDSNFNEIECIDLSIDPQSPQILKSISYDRYKNYLLLNDYDYIFKLDLKTMNSAYFYSNKKYLPYSIYSLDKYILTISKHDNSFILSLYKDCNLISICNLPKSFRYKSIICAYHKKNEIYVNILAIDSKNCENIITLTIKPNCEDKNNFDKIDSDCLNNCNSLNDAMESIALIETALSQILITECEKLKRGISFSTSVDELICLNASVEKTISQITNLEIQLTEKLSEIKKLYDKI